MKIDDKILTMLKRLLFAISLFFTLFVLVGCGTDVANRSPEALAARDRSWTVRMETEGVPNLYKVNDHFYRSAQPTKEGMKKLKAMGIKTVINLRFFHNERELVESSGMEYEQIEVLTWDPKEEQAVRFLEVVTDPNRQPVLLHCKQGADRAGTLTAVYRIAVEGWPKEKAIEEMTTGGYHYHSFWSNLPEWIAKLDIENIKNQAGI